MKKEAKVKTEKKNKKDKNIWRKPTLKEFRYIGCSLNGKSGS